MADAGKPQAEGFDKAKLKQYLVPAAAVAAVIVLAGLVMVVSGSERKMSDGSDGSAGDSGLKELASGVKYRDLKEGVGEACPPGAAVTMHYTGWLENGEVFDSTREGKPTKEPAKFDLANLIKGWQEGIPGMKKGGIRKLVVAPEKGYGAQKRDKIPANSTLIFEVELVDFTVPRDLSKLSDGTAPGADDPGLKPIGTAGLKYRDLKEGSGAPVQPGAKVTIHYTGWLTNGTVFDSSHRRGEPATFGLGGLIKGWQEGIPGMKPGGIRKLVIPPELGYGAQDKDNIPPNSTLVFEVELLQ